VLAGGLHIQSLGIRIILVIVGAVSRVYSTITKAHFSKL
jgi:hypothetical protein